MVEPADTVLTSPEPWGADLESVLVRDESTGPNVLWNLAHSLPPGRRMVWTLDSGLALFEPGDAPPSQLQGPDRGRRTLRTG